MFNIKEFILSNLIKGVNKNSFSKEYASILATNYLLKGLLSEEDLQRFDEETIQTEQLDTEMNSTEQLDTTEEKEEE